MNLKKKSPPPPTLQASSSLSFVKAVEDLSIMVFGDQSTHSFGLLVLTLFSPSYSFIKEHAHDIV